MTESIGTARLDIVVDTSSLDAGVSKAKRSTQDMAKAAKDAGASMEQNSKRQVASLEKQIATLGKSREEIIRWRIETQTAGETQKRLLAAHDAATAKITAGGKALNAYGVSAKQSAAALRGVPAQITDIAVALQSGQRPITVLLQQGGQLKDMFGGIVPAARALGGAIAGLINPFTVSAAAAAALFLAWKQGDDEAVAFRQAIALTGDAAGVTADQLQAMAVAMDSGATTQHEAAAALAEVTKSGKFTADQIRDVAAAAVAMERATGQSIEQTVAQFAKLGDDPVKAVVELNEKYHFLTAAVFEQIKALQSQGREEDAVNLAIRTSSAELKKRADDVVANAGIMERAWRGLGSVVRQVWDDIRNAGRASTAVSQAELSKQSAISGLRSEAATLRGFGERGQAISVQDLGLHKAAIERFKQQIAEAQKVIASDAGMLNAAKAAARQRANDVAIALSSEADSYKDAATKRTDRIAKVTKEANTAAAAAIKAGDTKLAADIRASEAKVIAGIRGEEKAATSADGRGRSGAGRATAIRALPDFSKGAGDELARLASQEERATESFLDMQATLQGPLAQALREHEKNISRINEQAADSPVAAAALTDTLALEAKRYDDVTAAIKRQLDPVGEALKAQALELDMIGKSNAEREVMNALLEKGADLRSADAQAALAQARANQAEAESRQHAIDMMDDFRRGAADALTDFVTGAKSAKDALKDFFNELAQQITRAIAEKWIAQAFGSQGSSGAGANGGWLSSIIGLFANANGNAFVNGQPVQAFANGGVFSSPTMFGMSNGRLGVMGEAGPEAILPLHRGPDGKLGVRMEAANDSHRPVVNNVTTFVLPQTTTPQTQAQVAQNQQRAATRATSRNR